jgi:ubiquinone/menaquinone biosynthesis C-methylase UbiE
MDLVYNQVARDFSRTRYKVWNQVAAFLDSLPSQTRVLEVGCGNGKNLLYRPDLSVKGLDITEGFLEICRERGLAVAYGDIRNIPEPTESYDAVLAIAVIHHLSTQAERRQAIAEVFRVIAKGGQGLLTVWAQQPKFPTSDHMVPFKGQSATVERFYHFYTAAELQEDLESVGSVGISWIVMEERDNWHVMIGKDLRV